MCTDRHLSFGVPMPWLRNDTLMVVLSGTIGLEIENNLMVSDWLGDWLEMEIVGRGAHLDPLFRFAQIQATPYKVALLSSFLGRDEYL